MKTLKSLSLLAAATLVVAACSSNDSPRTPRAPVNESPTIGAVADQAVDQDTVIGPLEFAVTDKETNSAMLQVTAAADSASLFPPDGVVVAGSGATRSITLSPLEAATGMATIALIVVDGAGASSVRSFKVVVNAKNASIRDVSLSTFAKAESDDPTVINGLTFAQDADDPATFNALIPADEP
jgi:hypothetical protein